MLKFVIFDFKELKKFAADFSLIYNEAFAEFEHFKPLGASKVETMLKQAKAIIDPHLLCIAYFNDQPAGFIALFPDINPLLRPVKGTLNWLTIPGFLWRKRRQKKYSVKGMGIGIRPDFMSKGVYSLLVDHMHDEKTRKKYDHFYLATIRSHNEKVISIYEKINAVPDRLHYTMRKNFSKELILNPFPLKKYDGDLLLPKVKP